MSELKGKRVLITRPSEQADEFAHALERVGAEPVYFPTIEIGSIMDFTEMDRALGKLACYDWLILTSVNGVQAVWERMVTLGITELPEKLQVATIGPKTASALQEHGIQPDFVPDEYIAEAILPGLGDLVGRWALLLRADIARPALARGIEDAGGVAHEVTAYRTLPAEPNPQGLRAIRERLDIVTFTSSSTVRNFVALVSAAGLDPRQLPGKPLIACIGPITAATAVEEGFVVDIVAAEYTIEGLLQALLDVQQI